MMTRSRARESETPYECAPDASGASAWLERLDCAHEISGPERPVRGLRVLSEPDMAQWHERGFVVVPRAVTEAAVERTTAAIWEFLGMDPGRPESWYEPSIRDQGMIDDRGMVSFYHHQTLWDNRQSPRVHGAFADIWGAEALLVSMDRVNMNPPWRPGWSHRGFIHFDIDTSRRPIAPHVQGVLSLSDAPANAGGFQCVPGFHRRIETWLDSRPPGANPRFPDVRGMEIVDVPLARGDLLIFNGALPHGNGCNRSASVRMAQYITMWPHEQSSLADREERLRTFIRRSNPRSPVGSRLPPDPRGIEEHRRDPVKLSWLGQRVLGARDWTGEAPA